MELRTDEHIKKLNTFGVDAKAKNFAEIRSVEDLKQVREYLQQQPQDFMVIGGGSNVLFREDYPGLLLRMMILGFEKFKEDEDFYFVRAGAGEVWHSFVRKMLDAGMPGLENLA